MLVERNILFAGHDEFQGGADDGMGGSDANTVFDAREGRCHPFYLDGIDFEAAHINDIPGASGEMNHTLLVKIAEVGGMNPSVRQDRTSCLFVIDIAAHHAESGNNQVGIRSDFDNGVLEGSADAETRWAWMSMIILRFAFLPARQRKGAR